MNKYSETVQLIEKSLLSHSNFSNCNYSKLLDAERYSLTAGGKHLRGLILIETARMGNPDMLFVMELACAIEMVHTYSLIHDDLPEMDNDDLRRGKPTCHKVYGADTALLAGDGLLTKAFSVICATAAPAEVRVQCMDVLADACGEHGMLAGQMLDKQFEGKEVSLAKIRELHARKTGDMFVAAGKMGAAAGGLDFDTERKLVSVISRLGAAFQIKDDILDVTSDAATLGKPINSDIESHKSTYVSLLGLDGANKELNRIISSVKDDLKTMDAPFFDDLADFFLKRTK